MVKREDRNRHERQDSRTMLVRSHCCSIPRLIEMARIGKTAMVSLRDIDGCDE